MDDTLRDRLAGPIGYDWWWGALGAALVLLALMWSLALVWAARRRHARTAHGQAPAMPSLRDDCTRRVDQIERQVERRELEPRDAALQLAAVARTGIAAREAKDARQVRAATALELHEHGLESLARTVAASYPLAFGRADEDIDALVREVRRLLAS